MLSPLWLQQLNENDSSISVYSSNYSQALALMALASGQNSTLNWCQVFMAHAALTNFNATHRQLPLTFLPTLPATKFNYQPILSSENFLKDFMNNGESKKPEKLPLKSGILPIEGVKSEKTDFSTKILSELLFQSKNSETENKNLIKTTVSSSLASTSSSISSGSCEEDIEIKSKKKTKHFLTPVRLFTYKNNNLF